MPVNTEVFGAFEKRVPRSLLKAGDGVLMNRHSSHNSVPVRALIKARGA